MKDLLTRALDARWREIEAFQLKVSIGGGLWRLLLLRSYPVRWLRHSDPPPGGQPHSQGCSALGSDGRVVTNE